MICGPALGGLLGKSGFLAGRLDQGKTPLRIDDGERQAWKAGAGADVGYAAAAQIGLQAQAVEDVAGVLSQPRLDFRPRITHGHDEFLQAPARKGYGAGAFSLS